MSTITSMTLLESLRVGGGSAAWDEFFRRYAPADMRISLLDMMESLLSARLHVRMRMFDLLGSAAVSGSPRCAV